MMWRTAAFCASLKGWKPVSVPSFVPPYWGASDMKLYVTVIGLPIGRPAFHW